MAGVWLVPRAAPRAKKGWKTALVGRVAREIGRKVSRCFMPPPSFPCKTRSKVSQRRIGMAKLTLYHASPSRSSIVRWMLEETGEPYDLHLLKLAEGEQMKPITSPSIRWERCRR